jgi:hypothetical protein
MLGELCRLLAALPVLSQPRAYLPITLVTSTAKILPGPSRARRLRRSIPCAKKEPPERGRFKRIIGRPHRTLFHARANVIEFNTGFFLRVGLLKKVADLPFR